MRLEVKAELIDQPLESEFWPQIEKAIAKGLEVPTATVGVDYIASMLGDGSLGLMAVRELKGFISAVAVLEETEGQWIDIPILWSDGLEALNCLFEGIEELAKTLRARGVKWSTSNEQGESYASRRGYKKRLTEYAKEV